MPEILHTIIQTQVLEKTVYIIFILNWVKEGISYTFTNKKGDN